MSQSKDPSPVHGHAHARADADDPDDVHDVHEGPIRTARQLIWTVVAAFLIPIAVIILLVNYVDFGTRPGAGSDGLQAAAIAERIRPVGTVDYRDTSSPASQRAGDQVFQGQCAACHVPGAAGAPKLGDVPAWAPRVPQGFQALVNAALKGKGAMPPQSGGDFSDFEISRAVHYMANQAGGKFSEPAMPAATTAAAAASAPN